MLFDPTHGLVQQAWLGFFVLRKWDLTGEFNWSLQQMPEISLLVFRILRFFLGVRSTAEPPY
jgi:hypothetical protein